MEPKDLGSKELEVGLACGQGFWALLGRQGKVAGVHPAPCPVVMAEVAPSQALVH